MEQGITLPIKDLQHSVRNKVVPRSNARCVNKKVLDRLRHCRRYLVQSHDFGIVLEFRGVVDFSLSNAVLENSEEVCFR